MAVRCCSPPDSVGGSCPACAVSPTSASTRSTAGRIRARGVPVTSSANATFSQSVFFGSSLKSWNTVPILRRTRGTIRRLIRARSSPSTTTTPLVATSSRISSRMSVDLPAPDGPTRKTKSPSGTTRSTWRSASLPLGNRIVTSCRTTSGRRPSSGMIGRLAEGRRALSGVRVAAVRPRAGGDWGTVIGTLECGGRRGPGIESGAPVAVRRWARRAPEASTRAWDRQTPAVPVSPLRPRPWTAAGRSRPARARPA